ncbi:hypothetical protein [Ruficoccus sp. ZRK36]|uniref:hypothetical protein n=1 Tax=Ruficoccus sp. ZRK36 TaxID=2866311 RepID=UPI001C72C22E|nr:hypothetical protein [Ruficoccus sp. ZRK36]QYY34793.1 hypothetical protein K0V07_10830 [Ruficoccus sp. ZRK36]
MNGKPVLYTSSPKILRKNPHYQAKQLCDGFSFSAGSTCAFSCAYCLTPELLKKCSPLSPLSPFTLGGSVIRRRHAADILHRQLYDGRTYAAKYSDPNDRRVVLGSPQVDVGANEELSHETIEICRSILKATHWQIRLLSRGNLLPMIAEALKEHKERMIYGVSLSTLDESLAAALEAGTPTPAQRIASLHQLQNEGYRTCVVVGPILPQKEYRKFARDIFQAIRPMRCEHVWTEFISRHQSSVRTTAKALLQAGYTTLAYQLPDAMDGYRREGHARQAYLAFAKKIAPHKLRFLHHCQGNSYQWWRPYENKGVILE